MKLDRLGLPHLLCCGVSTRRINGKYRCGKCERWYRLDGSRVVVRKKSSKPRRARPFMAWADLASASDAVLVEYALRTALSLFSARSHAVHGTKLTSSIAARYRNILNSASTSGEGR